MMVAVGEAPSWQESGSGGGGGKDDDDEVSKALPFPCCASTAALRPEKTMPFIAVRLRFSKTVPFVAACPSVRFSTSWSPSP